MEAALKILPISVAQSNRLLNVARNYIEQGLSVVSTNDQKIATCPWRKFQTSTANEPELTNMFNRADSTSIAICTGYGNLEVIDIDLKYDVTGKLFELVTAQIKKEQPELWENLFKVSTKSGGFHWYFRCKTIEGNQKLASRFATEQEKADNPGEKIKVLIETRGQGGYVIAPPSNGYNFCDEDDFNIKEITPEERDYLLWVCRSFNEVFEEIGSQKKEVFQSHAGVLPPWADYNNRGQDDMLKRLVDHDWKLVRHQGDKIIFKRPGNTSSISSGDFCYKHNLFTVFTTSSQFEAQKGYRPAAVFAMLECDNDWQLANTKLLAAGYGNNINQDTVLPSDIIESSPFYIIAEYFKEQGVYKNSITKFCEKDGEVIQEQGLNTIYINLYEKHKKIKGFSKQNFDLFINSENLPSRNPIKEYFESLKIENTKSSLNDLIRSLKIKPHESLETNVIKGATAEVIKTILTKWLIGIVASVYSNNYNPLMPVLIGRKNTGKTEFWRRLLPAVLSQYFAQSKFNEGKDSEALMCEKLLILNDELDGMNKNDAKTFRNFISQYNYTYRPPYAKQNLTVKRLASACGTSNEPEIINDPGNNRRIIPIEIIGIDYDLYNSINKEKLFAELYYLYVQGEQWNLDSTEIDWLDELSNGYESISIEREMIKSKFLPCPPISQDFLGLTTVEIMKELQDYYPAAKMNVIKIGKELKSLGFKQRSVRRGLNVVRITDCIKI